MADREERFLMRQRGAGARQLRDSGFDFAIPNLAGTPSRQSASKTRNTPGSRRKTPSSGASHGGRRKTAAAPVLEQVEEDLAVDVGVGPSRVQEAASSVRTPAAALSGRKRKSTAPGTSPAKRARTSAPAIADQSASEEEDVLESPATMAVPSTGKQARKRSSLGTSSRVVGEEGAEDDELASPESVLAAESRRTSGSTAMSVNKAGKRKEKQPLGPNTGNASKTKPTAASDAKPQKRKRGRPSKKSLPTPEEEASEPPEDEAEPQVAPVSRPRAAAGPTKITKPKHHRSTAAKPPVRPSTTAPRAPHRSSGAASSSQPALSAARVPTDGIPITVHRLTHSSTLTFFSPDGDGDELAAPPPLRKHAGVNAIDILAQISRELVAKTATSFHQAARSSGGAERSEARRKAKVVEGFGERMEGVMLGMTTALDHHLGLTHHARSLAKTRSALLAEVLALRQQRRRLALQHDAVRAAHERAARVATKQTALDGLLQDIQLAAERGRDAVMRNGAEGEAKGDEGEVGLELRVRDIVERVSSAGGRTGLLERLRRFNGFLEAVVGLSDDVVD